jgi:drug/metabolite transporter (DMT)-like permease
LLGNISDSHDLAARRRAVIITVCSAVMFGAMAFAAKISAGRLSGAQVSTVRFAIGVVPPFLVPAWRRAAMRFERPDLLLVRGLFGGLAVLLYFFAIQHVAVGVATLLNYTAPVFSGIFSMLFIGERFSRKLLLAMPIAFAGVLMVVHANAAPGELLGFGRWELAGLASAVFSGVAVTAIRAARRTESSWAVYTSFCVLGLLTNAPFGIAQWKTPDRAEWIALVATSILAIGAQLTMTYSLRWIDAVTSGVVSQLAVIVSMILGAVFLREFIGLTAAIGSALTIGGVAGVIMATSPARVVAPEIVD